MTVLCICGKPATCAGVFSVEEYDDIESHRSLAPALASSLQLQRAERIRRAALDGLRISISHLMDCITGARDPAAKAAYEAQLVEAYRDVDCVRTMEIP